MPNVRSNAYDRARKVQSVLFKKNKFNGRQAVDWLIAHGFRHHEGDIPPKSKYRRYRQYNPPTGAVFRTFDADPGIKVIYQIN